MSQGHGFESYHLAVWRFIFLTLKTRLTHNPHEKHEEYGEGERVVLVARECSDEVGHLKFGYHDEDNKRQVRTGVTEKSHQRC